MRKTTLSLFSVLGVALALGAAQPVQAQDFNARPHLDPSVQVKVAKTLARARRHGINPRNPAARSKDGSDCGNLVIGEFGSGRRAPKEVVIVAGDIININNNCRKR